MQTEKSRVINMYNVYEYEHQDPMVSAKTKSLYPTFCINFGESMNPSLTKNRERSSKKPVNCQVMIPEGACCKATSENEAQSKVK